MKKIEDQTSWTPSTTHHPENKNAGSAGHLGDLGCMAPAKIPRYLKSPLLAKFT